LTCAPPPFPPAQQVASQIAHDLVWNPKLENMQTVIIENILKELNAENESRQGPQGPLRFKFVGARSVSCAGPYAGRLLHREPSALAALPTPQASLRHGLHRMAAALRRPRPP